MAKATLHFWHPLCYTKSRLLLSKIPPHKNGISQLHCWFSEVATTNTLESIPKIKHRRIKGISLWSEKNSTLKSHDHESESYNNFKNFLTQVSPWQTTFGYFFAICAIFVRHHFLWVSYLSISGEEFAMCHFCKLQLFSNGIKGCHICWVYMMVVKL